MLLRSGLVYTASPLAKDFSPMIILAPMEGLLDHPLRETLTRVGGLDRCVSEFIRVTGTLLPGRVFHRIVPELGHGGRTPAVLAAHPERDEQGRRSSDGDRLPGLEHAVSLRALGAGGLRGGAFVDDGHVQASASRQRSEQG